MDHRASQISNTQKALHGQNAKRNLESLLALCFHHKYISVPAIPGYRTGRAGYNAEQFYAAFKIDFDDLDSWILYSTTSLKTDRVKEPLWDAYNIKAINPTVKKAYIVYPDSLDPVEKARFVAQNAKYIEQVEFSSIDGIISQKELYTMIEAKALGNLNPGQITDLQGRNFESQIETLLRSTENFRRWKTSDPLHVGVMYDLYSYIVNRLHPQKSDVLKIDATRDKKIIGCLPSGGNPKTDVVVKFFLDDNTVQNYTLSCKHPKNGSTVVTVHEYSADTFADVLDKDNVQLREILRAFQKDPTISGFGKDNCLVLEKFIFPYTEKLAKWVLSGKGGQGNNLQIATHILTYHTDTHKVVLRSVDEYYKELIKLDVKGHFGTLFTWTYPSKQRGKRIQLKCRVI